MADPADVETFALMFILLGVKFAWDGVARRHIRIESYMPPVDGHLYGRPAIVAGLISCALAGVGIIMGARHIAWVTTSCQQSPGCIASMLLTALFSQWQLVFLLLFTLLSFAMWARGAFEKGGPYAWIPLAPGVARSEKEVIDRVNARAREAHVPPIPEETIASMFSTMSREYNFRYVFARRHIVKDGNIDRRYLIETTFAGQKGRFPWLSPRAQRLLVTVLADYWIETASRAENANLWKRLARAVSKKRHRQVE